MYICISIYIYIYVLLRLIMYLYTYVDNIYIYIYIHTYIYVYALACDEAAEGGAADGGHGSNLGRRQAGDLQSMLLLCLCFAWSTCLSVWLTCRLCVLAGDLQMLFTWSHAQQLRVDRMPHTPSGED